MDSLIFLPNLIVAQNTIQMCRWKKSKVTDIYKNKVIWCERANAESRFVLLMY